jgi:LPXTG-motif cell wall-anchored protein
LTEDLGKQYKYGVSYADEEGNLLDYVIRYQVPNWQTGQDPINMMRLYPLNGSVTITNRNRMLTINKVWADDTPDDQTVQVQIYRAATPLTGTSAATIYTLAATKEVSADSPLTYEARSYGMDTNLNAFYYDYYVAEVPVEGYAATYTDAEGNPVSPVKLTVDGKTVTVYPAVKNITITNTEVVPQTVVTKTWEDGYDAHSDYGDGVYVGLFAKVLSESTVTNSDTGEVTTEFEEEYLLKQRRYLNKLNDWSVTWQMDDVGTTYYAGGNKVKYTIEGYYVAEYLYTTSGYKPVYYRMEDDEQVRTDSVVTISQYTTVNGTATVMKDGVAADNTARYYTAQLAEPTALYPADESVIIHNVPENQLTVTKAWADGLTPEPVTVGIYPVAYDSNDDIVRLYHESQELGSLATDAGLSEDFQWSVTLSEENNWTYTWTNLPTSVVLKDPDTDEDVTYSFTYCVYEAQYDEDPYLPVYYDGNHKLITDMITDFEGIPILAVSRPDDGVVNIENVIRNSDLIIDKQWAGVDEEERTPVTMKLYREMLDAEGNVVEEATLLDTVQLSADNDWETTVSDLPYYKVEGAGSDKKVYTYRYYIGEVQNNTDYNVTYAVYPALEDEPTMKTMPDGQNACYVKFDESAATYNPIYSVTVTNAKSYVLPMTGSIGTNWYTWSGVAILLIVYTLYKLYWHRQRKRSKGGENESPIS